MVTVKVMKREQTLDAFIEGLNKLIISFALLMDHLSFPHSSVGKESACYEGDSSSIPGWGRSTGEGIGYPLQYSGLKNSMDYIVHGVAKSRTRLSDFYFTSQ